MNGRGRLNRSADEDERRTAVFEARMTASKLGMKLKRSKPLRSRTKTSTPVPKKIFQDVKTFLSCPYRRRDKIRGIFNDIPLCS